ncbi:MAG: MGMT family protein [bacterium]|nr:MGMT family protein [bacterium]
MPKKSSKKPITSFQEKVYRTVKKIKKGRVMTYKQVARAIGCPEAFRAVGNALNKNQSDRIPCHRVVKSDTRAKRSVKMKTESSSPGSIGGYKRGTKKKLSLLEREGVVIQKGKVVL